jgi:hypothetical protein
MTHQVELSESSQHCISQMEQLLPGLAPHQLVETALAVTTALYQKVSDGGRILVENQDGKTEELRFRVRKSKATKTGSDKI